MASSGLGTLLVHEGLLTDKDRHTLARTCGSGGAAFAKGVIDLGLLDEEDLATFLAERTRFSFADKMIEVDPTFDPKSVMPVRLIQQLEVLPLRLEEGVLTVAMADPLDTDAVHQLEFFTGYKVRPVIATFFQIHEGIRALDPDFVPQPSGLSDFLINHVDAAARRLKVRDNLHIDTLSGPINPMAPLPGEDASADSVGTGADDDYMIVGEDEELTEVAASTPARVTPAPSAQPVASMTEPDDALENVDLADVDLGDDLDLQSPPDADQALPDLEDTPPGAADLESLEPEQGVGAEDLLADSGELTTPTDEPLIGAPTELSEGESLGDDILASEPSLDGLPATDEATSQNPDFGSDLESVESPVIVGTPDHSTETLLEAADEVANGTETLLEATDEVANSTPEPLDEVAEPPSPPSKMAHPPLATSTHPAVFQRGIVGLSLALNAKKAATIVADTLMRIGCTRGAIYTLADMESSPQPLSGWHNGGVGDDQKHVPPMPDGVANNLEPDGWLPAALFGWSDVDTLFQDPDGAAEASLLAIRTNTKKGGHLCVIALWPSGLRDQPGIDAQAIELVKKLARRL